MRLFAVVFLVFLFLVAERTYRQRIRCQAFREVIELAERIHVMARREGV
jgi:hypothetical protein